MTITLAVQRSSMLGVVRWLLVSLSALLRGKLLDFPTR
jgi:hypothetical protein